MIILQFSNLNEDEQNICKYLTYTEIQSVYNLRMLNFAHQKSINSRSFKFAHGKVAGKKTVNIPQMDYFNVFF